MPQSFDNDMMSYALRLAKRGLYTTDPNPRVGCVIVRDQEIVGEGFTSPVGGPHAEVNALNAAGEAARGATAYVTLEPCAHHGRTPPCTDALIRAGIKRVVYAIDDPNPLVNGGGAAALQAAGIKVTAGVLSGPARELNIGFLHRMRTGLPWVTVKMGASIDGKIALANGASQWITSEAARNDVQQQRARSSAVLTGSGTILADNPRLTVRAPEIDMLGRNVLRVVCDSQLRTPPDSQVLQQRGTTLIFTTSEDERRIDALVRAGAEVLQVAPDASGRVDLLAVLQALATRACNEVLVEAGPQLSGRLLELRLANELLIYIAPVVLGDAARSMFAMSPIASLAERIEFRVHEIARMGPDIRVRLRADEE